MYITLIHSEQNLEACALRLSRKFLQRLQITKDAKKLCHVYLNKKTHKKEIIMSNVEQQLQEKFQGYRTNHEAVNALAQTDADFANLCQTPEILQGLLSAVELLLEVELHLTSMVGFGADAETYQKLLDNFDYVWGRFVNIEKAILDGQRDISALQEYLAAIQEHHDRYVEIFCAE
jgi:hypothetical protein